MTRALLVRVRNPWPFPPFFFHVWLLDLSDKYVKILFERDSIFKHVL